MKSDDAELTPEAEAMIEADEAAQERFDEVQEAAAIEANKRRWVTTLARVLEVCHRDDAALVDEEVRDALNQVTVSVCEQLRRMFSKPLCGD